MKKTLLILGVGLFLQGCANNQFYLKTVAAKDAKISSDMKIAVIPENWYWLGVSNFLPRALITEFMDLGFTVVERSQLEEVFKELKLDASGATKDEQRPSVSKGFDLEVLDKTSIKKIGEMLGVNALLVTYIVPTSDDNVSKATFRLVDVETAQILFSTTFINSAGEGKTDGPVSVREIIESIAKSTGRVLQGDKKYVGKMTPRRNPNGSLSN